MLSIPATKAFEIGSGFRGTEVPGSKHNDPYTPSETGRLRTTTNWSGGVQGGITNGEDVYFRYADLYNGVAHLLTRISPCRIGFKSPATISRAQNTAQYDGTVGILAARGRHDPCVVPRAVPIVEAMASLVVMELVVSSTFCSVHSRFSVLLALFSSKMQGLFQLRDCHQSRLYHLQWCYL
jgi:chorismate synthase